MTLAVMNFCRATSPNRLPHVTLRREGKQGTVLHPAGSLRCTSTKLCMQRAALHSLTP
jgi:hypothetical protein